MNTSPSALILSNTIRVSNSLDPDQAPHFVGPDLGPKLFAKFPAYDTSRQKNLIAFVVELTDLPLFISNILLPFSCIQPFL